MAEKYLKLIFKKSEANNVDLNTANIMVYEEFKHRLDFDRAEFDRAEKAMIDKREELYAAWANDKFEKLDLYEMNNNA